jgi:hypothetical protein
MSRTDRLHNVGDVAEWLEQESSIQIKAVTSFGDPVELNSEEARRLAALLLTLAEQADA